MVSWGWRIGDRAARRIGICPTQTASGLCKQTPSGGTWIAFALRMIADELRARTRQFALDVILLCSQLGFGDLARVVRPQLLRAATGVAANYRAACRSRSRKEFISRLGVVVEECDEAELWLDVVETISLGNVDRTSPLRREAAEVLAVMSASRRTARRRLKQQLAKKKAKTSVKD